MTRRDFELIARTIRDARQWHNPESGENFMVVNDLIMAFADALATTNPNFHRERFIAAANGT